MDESFREARRLALADSSPYRIINLANTAVRSGFFQPVSRGSGRSGRKFSYLAAQAYITAERIRAAGLVGDSAQMHVDFTSHFPEWVVSRQRQTTRRLLARALIGGLDLDSLRVLLFEIGADVPVALWSPGGEGFDEVIRPLDYYNSGPSDDYTELYIVYQNYRNNLEVTLLDCIAQIRSYRVVDEDGNPDWEARLDDYEANVYRGFTANDISDADIAQMAADFRIDEEEIRSSITQPIGLAQAALEYHHRYGAHSIDDYPLVFETPPEVRRHFMLELVMQDRGFLH